MPKKRKHRPGVMGCSSIPYAQRLKMQQEHDIVTSREHSARIVMYCTCAALYDLEGIAYQRLIRFALHHKTLVDEFYEDPEVGMAHCEQRMGQLGVPIEGEFYIAPDAAGVSKRRQELQTHALQSMQVALYLGAIAANDVFGFGKERQHRLWERTRTYSARYGKEGVGFLLEKMQKIGFTVARGRVLAFVDEDGKPVKPPHKNTICIAPALVGMQRRGCGPVSCNRWRGGGNGQKKKG